MTVQPPPRVEEEQEKSKRKRQYNSYSHSHSQYPSSHYSQSYSNGFSGTESLHTHYGTPPETAETAPRVTPCPATTTTTGVEEGRFNHLGWGGNLAAKDGRSSVGPLLLQLHQQQQCHRHYQQQQETEHQQHPQYCYSVVTLERSSVATPWGFSICVPRNGRVVVGHVVSSSSSSSRVRGVWTAASWVPPSCFVAATSTPPTCCTPSNAKNICSNPTEMSCFVRHLIQQPKQQSPLAFATPTPGVPQATTNAATTGLAVSDVLAAGDCLVAVAGVPVAALGAGVTRVLRTHPTTSAMQLVVYHNPMARRAAAQAAHGMRLVQQQSDKPTNEQSLEKRTMTPAYAAALAAGQVLSRDCPPPATEPPPWIQMGASLCVPRRLFAVTPAMHPSASCSPRALPERTELRRLVTPTVTKKTKNTLFVDPITGEKGIPFVDDDDNSFFLDYDPDDGNREALFLRRMDTFPDWLERRKSQWRQKYTARLLEQSWVTDDTEARFVKDRATKRKLPCTKHTAFSEMNDRRNCNVAVEFWMTLGFATYSQWLTFRTTQWKARYSWNLRKRKALEHDCVEVVHLPNSGCGTGEEDQRSHATFTEWLRVRKNQWKVMRRKRQRRMAIENVAVSDSNPDCTVTSTTLGEAIALSKPAPIQLSELIAIDALLEAQERECQARDARPPLDILFVFDSELGCPDDVVTHIFSFLNATEHGKFLCISRSTRAALVQRETMWRQLSPSRWKLPRRPRKPWHELYLTNLRIETERSRKHWDDLLSRAGQVLLNGDQLQLIEKVVSEAETSSKFDVNYVSGVVCERNSLLNLAVIHQRHSKFNKS